MSGEKTKVTRRSQLGMSNATFPNGAEMRGTKGARAHALAKECRRLRPDSGSLLRAYPALRFATCWAMICGPRHTPRAKPARVVDAAAGSSVGASSSRDSSLRIRNMSKPFVFVSCGQYTEAEKSLGKSISKMVKAVTGFDAFFAEEVQDLNGLDSNILGALRDASAIITVLHPRGEIVRPDGTTHIRASVWIEQEIAIATYIQRIDNRPLPVIAFVHKSVGREGLRDLVHLNPIEFTDAADVLGVLPVLLEKWQGLRSAKIDVELQSSRVVLREGHRTRQLFVNLVNNTNDRILRWNGRIRLPAGILKHWTSTYPGEDRSDDSRYRVFRCDEEGHGPILPQSTQNIIFFDYCTQCAVEQFGDIPEVAGAIVAESTVEVKVWINGREYSDAKTIKELSSSA
jgi:hypothetical protein